MAFGPRTKRYLIQMGRPDLAERAERARRKGMVKTDREQVIEQQVQETQEHRREAGIQSIRDRAQRGWNRFVEISRIRGNVIPDYQAVQALVPAEFLRLAERPEHIAAHPLISDGNQLHVLVTESQKTGHHWDSWDKQFLRAIGGRTMERATNEGWLNNGDEILQWYQIGIHPSSAVSRRPVLRLVQYLDRQLDGSAQVDFLKELGRFRELGFDERILIASPIVKQTLQRTHKQDVSELKYLTRRERVEMSLPTNTVYDDDAVITMNALQRGPAAATDPRR